MFVQGHHPAFLLLLFKFLTANSHQLSNKIHWTYVWRILFDCLANNFQLSNMCLCTVSDAPPGVLKRTQQLQGCLHMWHIKSISQAQLTGNLQIPLQLCLLSSGRLISLQFCNILPYKTHRTHIELSVKHEQHPHFPPLSAQNVFYRKTHSPPVEKWNKPTLFYWLKEIFGGRTWLTLSHSNLSS